MKCTTHPEVETNLKCSKCDKPICPKCLVETPVGARCPECARLRRLPTYSLTTGYYLKALGTSMGMAVITGLIWSFLPYIIPFYLNLLIAPLVGYLISETIGLVTNRKRGIRLAVIAVSGLLISYVIHIFMPWSPFFSLLDILALALGIFVAISRIR